MLRALNNRITDISGMKKLTLLLCTVLILTIGIGSTFSYVVTGTPTLLNVFLNGMNPDGDLVIQKNITHPYGDTYSVPEDLAFTFEVDLGEEYAGEAIKTSQGEKTADEKGILVVTVSPGGRTTVYDIENETNVIVTETNIDKGFTPDAASYAITVQKHQDNIVNFLNDYLPEKADTKALTVSGVKSLVGREWIEGDSFTFDLSVYREGAWSSLGTQAVAYEPIGQKIPEDFNQFDFTNLIRSYSFDEAGIYSFRIREKEGTIGGIIYDKAESRFNVLVGDADMDGYLEIQSVTSVSANTTVDGMSVNVAFENSYAPAGSTEAEIEIQKVLEDISGQNRSPIGFTFELYDAAGELVTTSEPTDLAGETSIRLVYQPEDAGKVFNYMIKESRAGETIDALTYDDTMYQLQVAVRDNLDGTVSAYIYDAQANGNVVGSSGSAAGVSSPGTTAGGGGFGVVSDGDASSPVSGGDASNIPSGGATVSGGDAGTMPRLSGVKVPKDATGTYQAVFTNKYDPQDAFVTIKGTKILNGRALNVGEFTFLLYQTEALFAVPEGAQAVSRVVNDEDGAFCFAEMSFDRVGDYYYVVAEDATGGLGGVVYDSSRYLVTVKVRDYNGKLGTSVSITNVYGEASDIVFVNSYQPAPVSLPMIGRKILSGAKLIKGAFCFDLAVADESYAAQGEAFQTVFNQGDGTIAFEDLRFAAAGTYRYVVTEQRGTVEGMIYDDAVYCITVEVLDPGDGQLVIDRVTITTEGQTVTEILFENTYVEPSTPQEPDEPNDPDTPDQPDKPGEPDEPDDPDSSDTPSEPDTLDEPITESPKTGDDSNIWLSVVVAVLSAGAVILLLVLRWRRKSGK